MIRWPWVSRSYHEDVLRRADADALATVDVLRGQIAAAHAWEREAAARYDDLLARYHMLKLQGFSEPAAPVVRPVAAFDPIKRAIAQRAGTNRQLRDAMERQVMQDRTLGKSDEDILNAINTGVSGDDLILSEAGLMSP